MRGRITTLLIASILLSTVSVYAFNPKLHYQTGFVENKGQVTDQFGNSRNDVKYIFSGNGFKMILKNNSWSYEFYHVNHFKNNTIQGAVTPESNADFDLHDAVNFKSHRIDVQLLNANTNPVIIAEGSSEDVRNYYTGENISATGISHFSQITYKEIYPNIDLQINCTNNTYSEKPSLKYSFIVHPGGKVKDIQLLYEGQESLSIIDGITQLTSALGVLHDSAPVYLSGDEQLPVAGKFLRDGNRLSFLNVNADPLKTLVIDPQISYSTYYGGDSTDYSEDLLIDHHQNIVVCGRTASASNIATAGSYQTTYAGGNFDVFILKFNASFQLQWATYFGGNKVDYGWTLDVDHLDNIYLGGESSSQGLATAGAQQKYVNGTESDGLVAKFNSSGVLMWSRYFGGNDKDQILGIKIDPFNRVLIDGYTLSADSIATPGSFQAAYGNKGDGFLAVMDSNGKTIWATYYGKNKDDRSHHVTTDSYGNIIMSGTALSPGLATSGTFHPNPSGFLDAFLVKFRPSGTRVWATYFGGANDDRAREVEVDHHGNILLCGYTQSDTGVASAGAFKTSFSSGYDSTGNLTHDAFLAKFDSNGNRLWSTYFGDILTETARGLAINSNDDVFIAGTTFSANHIAYGNAYQQQLGGISDLYFAKFNTNGNLIWSSYFGGSADEVVGGYGQVIRVDNKNAIYLSGSTLSTDSIATPGAYKTSLTSNAYDLYIAKFSDKCFDRYEPNNSFAGATQINSSSDTSFTGYYAAIATSTDKDFYRFTLPSGVPKLKVQLLELPTNYDLYLYDSLKNQMAVSKKTGMKNELIQVNNPYAGKFYVKVIPRKNSQFNDSLCYRLKVISDGTLSPRELITTNSIIEDSIQLYPNPADNYVSLIAESENNKTVSLIVADLTGRRMLEQTLSFEQGENYFMIDVNDFPEGIYLVIINEGSGQTTRKFIIAR